MNHTYCNPLDLNYRYQHMKEGPRAAGFREGADPTLVCFKDTYYLFVSMSAGFWYSDDLLHWDFHPDTELLIYDYAPDVRQVGEYLYFCASRKGNAPFCAARTRCTSLLSRSAPPLPSGTPICFWMTTAGSTSTGAVPTPPPSGAWSWTPKPCSLWEKRKS